MIHVILGERLSSNRKGSNAPVSTSFPEHNKQQHAITAWTNRYRSTWFASGGHRCPTAYSRNCHYALPVKLAPITAIFTSIFSRKGSPDNWLPDLSCQPTFASCPSVKRIINQVPSMSKDSTVLPCKWLVINPGWWVPQVYLPKLRNSNNWGVIARCRKNDGKCPRTRTLGAPKVPDIYRNVSRWWGDRIGIN